MTTMSLYSNKYSLIEIVEIATSDNFQKHAETNLGQISLSTVHLSELMVKAPDGYFAATAKISVQNIKSKAFCK